MKPPPRKPGQLTEDNAYGARLGGVATAAYTSSVSICRACGEDNPQRARFCLACGAPLDGALFRDEVRKMVTIVRCDVTGWTSLGGRFDPELLRRVQGRFFETMESVVERHGGTVEKFVGDAVIAVFGIPTVREDDALRAVRAAAEMRQALVALNAELDGISGAELQLRIGVNTGEVVTGNDTGSRLVTGDPVSLAARLEAAA
jgi:class 3 adenylate cyclase